MAESVKSRLPIFVAGLWEQAILSADQKEATCLLLYAAHRLLRLLAHKVSKTPLEASIRSFKDFEALLTSEPVSIEEPIGKAIRDLVAASDLFLGPLMEGRPNEVPSLVPEVETLISSVGEALLSTPLCTAGPSAPDIVFDWSGPKGLGARRLNHNFSDPTTFFCSEEQVKVAKATSDFPPLPLIFAPYPAAFEDPRGLLFSPDLRELPVPPLTARTSLGRLLFFHMPEGSDPIALASSLAEGGLGEAAAEVLLLSFFPRLGELTSERIEEIRHFLSEHRLEGHLKAFDACLLDFFEAEERRRREAEDFQGVAEILLARQKIEHLRAKVLTLERLANLFGTRLNEPKAEFFCRLAALEEVPEDKDLLSDVVEGARRASEQREGAKRLLALAKKVNDKDLARAAAQLFLEIEGEEASAREAFEVAITSQSHDYDLLVEASEVAIRLKDSRWLESLLQKRKAIAPTREAYRESALALAVLLQESPGREEEALLEFEGVLRLDPSDLDVLEAYLALCEAKKFTDRARSMCELCLSALFEPKKRLWVLKRYAGLLERHFPQDQRALMEALAEVLLLDPKDIEAAQSLLTLYEEQEEWPKVLALLKKLAHLDEGRAVSLLLEAAEVAERRLSNPDAALALLLEAASRDPTHPEPPKRLCNLYESLGQWWDLAALLRRRAETLEGDERALVLEKLAHVLAERIGQRQEAKEVLKKGIEEASGKVLFALARKLADMCHEDQDKRGEVFALEALLRALPPDDEAIADIHTALAELFAQEPLKDLRAARAHLEKAVSANPLHPAAVERLASLLLEAGEPEPVIAMIEPLLEKIGDKDLGLEFRLRILGAKAASQVKDYETAAKWLSRAYALQPDNSEIAIEGARALIALGRDSEARALLEGLLGKEGVETRMRLEALRLASQCASRSGDHKQALLWLDEAQRLSLAKDVKTLEALVAEAQAANDDFRLLHYLEKLVAVQGPGPERYANKMRLGDLYRNALKDPSLAVQWFLEASKEALSPVPALIKALDAAIAAGMHAETRSILERLIEEEQDGRKVAQYRYALALLLKDHFNESIAAIGHLWQALDLDPENAGVVSALESLLSEASDYEGLARLYRLLIRYGVISGKKERFVEASRHLATLYLERLENPVLAADVFKSLLESPFIGDEERAEVQGAYADLLTKIPGKEAMALSAHREAVAQDPTRVESYRAIYTLCNLMGDKDGAWCAASALYVLGKANEAEKAFFEAGRKPTLMLKRDSLPPETFQKLIADDLADQRLRQVLHILYAPVCRIVPYKQPKDLGLSDKDIMDMNVRAPVQNFAMAASKIFGVPLPRLYRVQGFKGVAKLPFSFPAIAVGDDAANLWRGKELRFAFGRTMSAFAPGFELVGVTDCESLRLFILAALRIYDPDFPVPEDVTGVPEMALEFSKVLAPQTREALILALKDFMKSKKAIDLEAYCEGVDRTVTRAGLFLGDDLKIAALCLQEDASAYSSLEYGDRLTDLCAYVVSERYAELRRLMLKF